MGKQIPINPGLAAQRNKGIAHTSYANATVNRTVRQNRIRLETRGYEIQDGKPLVVFTKEENDLLAQTCKWTIICNISHIRPSIDIIRKEFAKMISSKGNVKIGAYDMHHVFIDFGNVDDHLNVYSKNFLTFGETHIMKILRWTPNFKPEAETTLAPVWINLPDLPWHFYEWDAIQRICKSIGTPLIMDKATSSKTRPATAKVRIEVDLTRPLVYEVLVEIQNEEGKLEVITQKVEYETILAFCSHCKVQGHRDEKCRKLHPELRQEPGKNTNDVGQSKNVMDNQFTDGKKAPMTNKEKNEGHNKHHMSANPPQQDNDPGLNQQEDGWQTVERRKGRTTNNEKYQGNNVMPQRVWKNAQETKGRRVLPQEKQNSGNFSQLTNVLDKIEITEDTTASTSQREEEYHPIPTRVHNKTTINNMDKKKQKTKILKAQSKIRRNKHQKETNYPDIKLQDQDPENLLIRVEGENLNKTNNKGRKFAKNISIPPEVTFVAEESRNRNNDKQDIGIKPLFGLDPILSGMNTRKKVREMELEEIKRKNTIFEPVGVN
ncbi:hypothetical protein MTR67_036909 [Solanum verrucosum]|uniref:DUF4283 domain-containing protein n=1 Tax=Solanum verrucosum TaxID=315347 RepID=A0AAF0UCX7_SOLVR|nr:hypothetical protein MTR67_036909 [Solanum verrucosum]